MYRKAFSRIAKVLLGGTIGAGLLAASPAGEPIRSHAQNILPSFARALAYSAPALDVSKSCCTPWNSNWDGRDVVTSTDGTSNGDSSNSPRRPKCSRHIILVRHGQYHYAADDSDCHLTKLGREQTDYTGQRLKQLNLPYSRIIYSTMTRAVESTDEIIKYLPEVPAVPCDRLREGAPFPPQPPVPNWPSSKDAFNEDGPRIEAAFNYYMHRADPDQEKDSYEILVCHANVIRYFVCRSLQLPPEAWIRMTLDHGSLTWITIRPTGTVSLRWLGNSGYMPADKLSVQ
ncbi:unnamed protein product [Dibothriocephalus latus]|uniref:Serine/threonine-protein phosphatase PGAM5, mitochondrial n=1 Tax=Dibothriocephalus latus TaxID=60516 RepID=A0A3P7LWR1_DIBLA|nr:unnamed protein product [Dibothriocephalus latus]